MIVRLATDSMRTRFEIVLSGPDEPALLAAGEEAIAEIESCEERLSLFRPGSLLSIINREAAQRPVGVDRETFDLLQEARRLHHLTEGAFDPTVAPLLKTWRLHDHHSSAAAPASIDDALACVGMRHVELDHAASTVRFTRPGVSLDLGGLAKGHALSLAEAVLRRAGIGAPDSAGATSRTAAFLHAGTSSIIAIAAPVGRPGWQVALAPAGSILVLGHPPADSTASSPPPRSSIVATLRDQSMSVSSPAGRTAGHGPDVVHHIIDPRTGRSAAGASIAAAIAPSALQTEALSTALIVLNRRPRALSQACVTILPPADPASIDWRIEGADARRIVYLSPPDHPPDPSLPKDPT